jgi:phage terminase large subunit-like protein
MTGAWDNKGNLWVVDITRGHASGPEMQAWIRGHVAKYQPRAVLVERVGMQAQLKHWLRHDMMKDGMRFNIVETKRDRSHKKYPRIEALEPMAADGRLWIKNGFEGLVYELVNLRAAKHDDMADCLADIYEFGQQPRADVDDSPQERLVVNSPWVMRDIVDRDLKQRELLAIDASSGWSVEF